MISAGRAPATSGMKRARAAVTVAALGMALTPQARGSMCVIDGMFVEVSPATGAVVPRNARVRVRLTKAPHGKTPPGRLHLDGPDWSGPIDAVTVLVRAVGARGGEPALVANVTSFGMEQERIVELVPRELLARHRRFEIMLSASNGPPRSIGTFNVGAEIDARAPVWKGLTRAEILGRRPQSSGKDAGGVIVESSASRDRPWLIAEAPAATDGATTGSTPAAAMAYGLWVASTPGATIDYTRPPVSYVSRRKGVILAGRDAAYPENDLCDLPLLPLPSGQTTLRVGIRAVDWAGNASPPSEVTVNVDTPATKTP